MNFYYSQMLFFYMQYEIPVSIFEIEKVWDGGSHIESFWRHLYL